MHPSSSAPARRRAKSGAAVLHTGLAVTLLLLGAALVPAQAEGSPGGRHLAPMPWRNASPPVAFAGLPRARSAALPTAGRTDVDLLIELASHFAKCAAGETLAFVDGETVTAVARLEHGFADGWAASLELPWVHHGPGFLDGIIDGYHDLFALPDGGRETFPADDILFLWRDAGTDRLRLGTARSGPGDVRIGLARSLTDSPARALALRLDAELPTGDADQLTGSDGTDVALGLSWTERALLSKWGLTAHISAGALWRSDAAHDEAEDRVAFGNVTLAWSLGPRWVLEGQLDAHSRLIDSGLREIGGWGVQGGLAAAWAPVPRWSLELGFMEDLRTRVAPDIAFQLTLRGRL